ncbi:MAG: hypothetical protein QFE16_05745 [Pseudomonadota bacterium]|nr:hypothetical protein [Pseudomonadota bacterium]
MRTVVVTRNKRVPLLAIGSRRTRTAGGGRRLSPTTTSAPTQSGVTCSAMSALSATVTSSDCPSVVALTKRPKPTAISGWEDKAKNTPAKTVVIAFSMLAVNKRNKK